jgi:hypothetical protein
VIVIRREYPYTRARDCRIDSLFLKTLHNLTPNTLTNLQDWSRKRLCPVVRERMYSRRLTRSSSKSLTRSLGLQNRRRKCGVPTDIREKVEVILRDGPGTAPSAKQIVIGTRGD